MAPARPRLLSQPPLFAPVPCAGHTCSSHCGSGAAEAAEGRLIDNASQSSRFVRHPAKLGWKKGGNSMYIPIPIVIGAVALILVLLLMRRGRAGRRDLLEPPAAMQIPAVLADEARILLAQGDKIAAIELVREQSGLGLKESKDFVERLEPDS